MEVRQEPVDDPEFEARMDEKGGRAPRPASSRPPRPALSSVRTTVVPTAITGPLRRFGVVDRVRGPGRDLIGLLEHPVVVEPLDPDRLEGGQPDFERDPWTVATPVPAIAARTSGVKWSPAVGAAIAPSLSAKTV